MDEILKLKIAFDNFTGRISDYCKRKNVRRLLLFIKWLTIGLILLDTFVYGQKTGNFGLFTAIFVTLITTYLTRRSTELEGNEINSEQRQVQKPGMRKVCDKCDVKMGINYGDAYNTLCRKCA